MSELMRDRIQSKYRIINNGKPSADIRYKVQRDGWFSWRDCNWAGKYTSAGDFPSVGIYKNEEDAALALNSLVQREIQLELRKF